MNRPNCFGINYNKESVTCEDCEDCKDALLCMSKSGTLTNEPDEIKTAPKDNAKEGKPRASLIPWDILIEFLTPAYEEGLIKYTRESWRGGFKITDLKDALDRHITAFFYQREDYDPDAAKLGVRKHHLAGAMFCILSILWTLKTRPELDDRPKWDMTIPIDPVEICKGVQQKKFDDDSKGHM